MNDSFVHTAATHASVHHRLSPPSYLTEEQCAGENGGYFGAFVKYGQPPGWRYGEWDFRPEWNYFGERQEDVEVRFDASKEAWQTGVVSFLLVRSRCCRS